MSLTRREKILLGTALILLLINYLCGLFIDVTRDAAKYAYISKEIVQQGNWFHLMIMGEPYSQKPPLLFWLSATFFKLFGLSNFTFKLPVFLYSLLGFFAVCRLGKSLYNTKIGVLSSLILLFSVISILYNMDIHTDIVLMTNVSLSLWMLHEYLSKNRWKYLIGSGIALGLSILTKGPFGVVIPLFAVTGFLLSTNKFEKLISWDWLFIFLIALATASPAVIPIYLDKGFEGLKFFLWDNNFRRVVGDYQGGNNDQVFYIHNLIYLFLPWTIILFSGIFFQFKDFFRRKFTPNDHFVFWGTWVFFLIVSISKNKLPNYLLSLVPLLSIITAKGWVTIFDAKISRLILLHKVVVYLLWVLIFSMPIFLFPGMSLIIWLILGTLFLITLLVIKSAIYEKKLLLQTLLTVASLSLILNFHVFQTLFNLQGAPVAAKIVNVDKKGDKMVYFLCLKDIEIRDKLTTISQQSTDRFTDVITELHFYRNYEFMFYSDNPVIYIEHLNELPEIVKQSNCWIYTDEAGKNEVLKFSPEKISITPISNFNMKRVSRYFNPKTRDSAFETMFLVHLEKINFREVIYNTKPSSNSI
jgi:4-amino-4-deoxy-L-arabinose transferase-like glycosyltransferase